MRLIKPNYKLQTTQRYFLKKDDRLKSRKAIESLFAKGKSFSNFPFRILWLLEDESSGLKAGFSASSKNFKKATDRNKIRRIMREAYRLQKNDLSRHLQETNKALHLFFIYTGKNVPTFDLIFEKTGTVLKRIVKLTNENI